MDATHQTNIIIDTSLAGEINTLAEHFELNNEQVIVDIVQPIIKSVLSVISGAAIQLDETLSQAPDIPAEEITQLKHEYWNLLTTGITAQSVS